MNIKPNVHNFIMITGLAILGLIMFKLAAKTRLASFPVLGDALRLGASA